MLPAIIIFFLTSTANFPDVLAPNIDRDELRALQGQLERELSEGRVGDALETVGKISALQSRSGVVLLVRTAAALDNYPELSSVEKGRLYQTIEECLSKASGRGLRKYVFDQTLFLGDRERKVVLAGVVGIMAGDDAEKILLKLLKKRDYPAVQNLAARALGRRQSVRAVEPLIRVLKKREGKRDRIWKAAQNALVEITGYEFWDAAGWKSFWKVRKEGFDPKKGRGHAGREGPPPPDRTIPRFFGQPVHCRNVIFVFDRSGSMHIKDPPQKAGESDSKEEKKHCRYCGKRHGGVDLPESRSRISRVKSELAQLIEDLPEDTRFNVIAMADKIVPVFEGGELVEADAENKAKAIDFVKTRGLWWGTSTDKALDVVFEHAGVDAVHLLSDGEPWRGKPLDPNIVHDLVAWKNRLRLVSISTYGFWKAEGVEFLRKLALDNGGSFTSVR